MRACVCVYVCFFKHLLLIRFVFPPRRGPPLHWVLDSQVTLVCVCEREREKDRDKVKARWRENLPSHLCNAAKKFCYVMLIHICRLQSSCGSDSPSVLLVLIPSFSPSHFVFPRASPQCFSCGLARSIHLPPGSRCRLRVQMFCVYHSPVTSLTNCPTVNIYRGVSSYAATLHANRHERRNTDIAQEQREREQAHR